MVGGVRTSALGGNSRVPENKASRSNKLAKAQPSLRDSREWSSLLPSYRKKIKRLLVLHHLAWTTPRCVAVWTASPTPCWTASSAETATAHGSWCPRTARPSCDTLRGLRPSLSPFFQERFLVAAKPTTLVEISGVLSFIFFLTKFKRRSKQSKQTW